MTQAVQGLIPTIASKSQRLLFVINSAVVGGAERHTFDLAAGLQASGWHSTVFAMKRGNLEPPAGVALLQPEAPCSFPARIGTLRSTILMTRPNLIVSVNERPVFAATLGRLAARAAAIPLVAIMHSTILNNFRERMAQLLYNRFFNRAESVVFVSNNQRIYWRHHGLTPRCCETILNGINVESFAPAIRDSFRAAARDQYAFADDDLVLGLCAVMRPEKNHAQLLEVTAQVLAEGLPIKIMLVGDGPCRPLIVERARALNIEDRVTLVGMTRDVRPCIAAFDVGILCSLSIETLSLAALEIMAMGVPMIMSDLSGASEIVDGRNGRLFPVGDNVRFAAAVRAMSRMDIRLAAGIAARRSVEKAFGRQAMLQRYETHFSVMTLSRRASNL